MTCSSVWREMIILKYRKLHSISFIISDKDFLTSILFNCQVLRYSFNSHSKELFHLNNIRRKVQYSKYRLFNTRWRRIEYHSRNFFQQRSVSELLSLQYLMNYISIFLYIRINLSSFKCWQYNKDSAKKPWKAI